MKIIQIMTFILVAVFIFLYVINETNSVRLRRKCRKVRLDLALKDIRVASMIKVIRKNRSIRYVVIFIDENSNKYRFVNLTKGHNHICRCSFDSYDEAIEDLNNDPNVMCWDYI